MFVWGNMISMFDPNLKPPILAPNQLHPRKLILKMKGGLVDSKSKPCPARRKSHILKAKSKASKEMSEGKQFTIKGVLRANKHQKNVSTRSFSLSILEG